MTHHADIDIDIGNRNTLLELIKHVPARINVKGKPTKHNSGVYIQDIPYDPQLEVAAIDYKEADRRGYFKLDFLNMHVYDNITSPEHYETLLKTEPPWERLAEKEFTEQLVHIGNYYELMAKRMPDSIPRMAMLLAAIRPGKSHLRYTDWASMNKDIWTPTADYYFKQAHAVSYAVLVALHMNIINGVK